MKTRYIILTAAIMLLMVACERNRNEVKPQRKDLQELVFASGVLEADDKSNLTAQTDGYIVSLGFKEGDMVHTGQLLAMIDNNQNRINARNAAALHGIAESNTETSAPAFQQIAANIASAKAKLQLDKIQAARYKRLYESNSVSKLEYENAELTVTNSQAQLDALQQQYNNQQVNANEQEITQRTVSEVNQVLSEQNHITAVISGRIYEKKKQLGDYVRKGDVIATIGNPKLIYAKLNVDETNMSKIHVGQETTIQLNTNKNKTYKAYIHEILPSFDEATQSFIVKAWFTDSLDFRITGTQLEANVHIGEKKNVLVIPRNYLGYGNKITIKGRGQVVVQTGIVSTEWAEILSGISENDVLQENK